MNTSSEYIEGQEPRHTNTERKFEKAKDPDTEKILEARKAVTRDPRLTDGARNFFTVLLDMSLSYRTWHYRRGQVAISNRRLREEIGRSARAIYGWTFDLVEAGYLWVSKLPRPNTQPVNVLHIAALQPKREGPELAGDGMWGNGYRRPERAMPAGARGASCKKRHYLLDQFGNPIFSNPEQNAAETRTNCGSIPQNLRETPAKKDTWHPQNLRETEAKFAGPSRKNEHLPSAKIDTTPQQKGAVLTESIDVRSRRSETLNSVQRSNAFKKGGEKCFLNHVAEVMARYDEKFAREELSGSGAWWLQMYRKDSDKITRVLAEVERMIKEREPFRINPGACAVDIWKRFA